jgi:hypothetical protein
MKRISRFFLLVTLVAFSLAVIAGPALCGGSVTFSGRVNDNYQIVTDDGEAYYVAEGDEGDELVELVGHLVQVSGSVTEEDDAKIISVTSYRIIEE